MNIGVDATCWSNGRGYGRHARALVSSLVRFDRDNRYTLLIDSPVDRESLPAGADVRCVKVSSPTSTAASSDGHRSIRDMWAMSRALSDRNFDALLFPTAYSFVPVVSQAKKIVMIHDVIAEKFPALTVPRPSARLFWKTKMALARWQANAIVTVSDYSRKAILQHFKLAPERVFVVGEASDQVFRVIDRHQPTARLQSLGVFNARRSIVYVGGFNPHKNLESLVDTFAEVAALPRFADVQLVLVGEYRNEVFHSYYATVKERIDRLGIADRVILTGFLTDADLVVLLNLSTVLVLPSFMEGFGLPAIEAAACGCPVIATKESPLPELLGDGAICIDPSSPQELSAALAQVLESTDLRERMRCAGVAAARRLTWEMAARQMSAVIQEIVGQ